MQLKTLSEYWKQANEILQAERERGGVVRFPTGVKSIDTLTGGIRKGEIWIFAGPTGGGKTSLALQTARECSDVHDNTVLFLSLEMRGWQLLLRMFCEMEGYNHDDVINGRVEISEAVRQAFDEYVKRIDFEIVEGGYVFDHVEKFIKEYYTSKKPDVIFLDFIQLVEWKMFGDERVALTEYIRKIKQMANELNVAFVIISQFRRLPSGADYNRAPDLIDLKGSGSLEQAADKVFLIYRKLQEGRPAEYYINLAKNRQGKTEVLRVVFEGHRYKFRDYTDQDFEFDRQRQEELDTKQRRRDYAGRH